jgi:hypothetical protein
MKRIELKVGSYYLLLKPPGVPVRIIEIIDKQYKISILLKTELTLSKTGFDSLIKSNGIKEITKDKAELIALAYAI